MSLQGKTALVTGGSRGIGSAIAKRLAADGATVAITYAGNKSAANATVAAIERAGGTAFAFQANAADPASQRAGVEQAAAAMGGIDILVHNAGVAEFSTVSEDTDATFDRQFGVNVKGLHVGTRAALPHLRDGGRIILIGSISGEMAFPATTVYSATKAAVAALARGWAKELAARNILVNTVQPGPVDTDMNPADSEFAGQVLQSIPLGRYGKVEEIAGAVSFLAGPDSSYITGTTLTIDGGTTA
ncbi:3-oxoacyl-ACP reductase family protein [Sphingomonas dokdonensis]|uniref:3-oxoacyl-[acyl-carrier-protein] reductase FabG n=1 Tax=Sphingomonas dokdonensis TaxID=344880 RepID=A0A245ZFC7_9SPHN|nr:3-oxoacyl-ACP reductase family protein [Sphingomonas dokdonensis]OWK28457.1 3-oxoacyl-[acyl-carrier-protein] reductase FabG [Sphingomonas dokdonensis]